MRSDEFKKVSQGERLVIPARTFNAFIDAAEAHRTQQESAQITQTSSRKVQDTVLVRNNTGDQREWCDILGLQESLVKPNLAQVAEDVDGFRERIVMDGVIPVEDDHKGQLGILQDGLGDQEVGYAVADGITVCRVQMADEEHKFADVLDGDASKLLSSTAGSVRILWKELEADRPAPTDVAWCVVRVGSSSGTVATTFRFAEISGVQGTAPPYLYSADEKVNSAGTWVTGSLQWAGTLKNLAEIGPASAGARAMPVGSFVSVFEASAGNWFFNTLHYRGTYP